jgi:hypothetical protein
VSRLRAADVERAPAQTDEALDGTPVDRAALCAAAIVMVPVLRHLEDRLVEIGKDALPGWLRWLVGGLVDDVVGGLISALEEWQQTACT